MTASRRIFLAHASEDKPRARKLYDDLKARGFDPWLDAVDLMPGQIWKAEIPKAIRQAEMFLACLSSRSIEKRGYVQREFREALSAFAERPPGSIYLIPVRLDDCVVPDLDIPDLGLKLRDIQWVDLWEEGAFDRLVATIEHAFASVVLPEISSEEVLAPIMPPEQKAADQARRGTREQAQAAKTKLLGEGKGTLVTVFRDIDASWCLELVVVPRGRFTMGSPSHERGRFNDEGPQHRVDIGYDLAVGRYPITFDEYDRFAQATGQDAPSDRGWGRGLRPVMKISWQDAQAYVEWLARETRESYRLLSEAEWEYACRAGTTTRYWWGNEISPQNANCGRSVAKTTEVGTYPSNSWGLHDMHGDVWEWCEDCWNENYEGAPDDGSAWTSGDCGRRVLRGGAWCVKAVDLRSASRFRYGAVNRSEIIGFRVASTLTHSDNSLW